MSREHHRGHEQGCDGGRQNGGLAVDGVQDRQRHKPGVGHRRRHSKHRAAAQVASPPDANHHEHQHEAQDGAAAERQQKTPFQKMARRLLRYRDEQQRRHRHVIGEMHQPVGQRTRYVAELSGQPAGDDHREDGKHEVDDFHGLPSWPCRCPLGFSWYRYPDDPSSADAAILVCASPGKAPKADAIVTMVVQSDERSYAASPIRR